MKSMVIGGIILIIALMAGTYYVAGDAFNTDDYINALTFLGAAAIITISTFVVLKYVNQMKNDRAGGDLADENWDGIGEYKNPVPTGWALAFIGTILWMFWYFTIGYPINGFSQIGQWNEETNEYNAKFEQKWVNPNESTLNAMGQSLFLVQCAPCHGVDAEGIDGKAQDLTKRMSKDQIVYVIKNGANNLTEAFPGGMPPMMLQDEKEISDVAEYIANGFKGEAPAAYATCATCHGDNGEGMPFVGPNIKSYDDGIVLAVLKQGKKGLLGEMPHFNGRLNETQERALASYIRSIGDK
ncbi:cytochrome C oxidase subunit III [Aliarcobacter skirrowii]|uniref:c-type cytochrome n=1 Tax=Aliarcobacter skirrowii TaxID=28200 RepID=UPI0008241855|nr:c-type cytochrome [Aliarcobacter skirrowii]MDX4037270.1 c-type cytochrome [Aliarcobacter skirrowii]MDX4047883.1 c-type cytochrome [Aliarcobacter skirrowii]MDX4064834.1 c-type cytochrome [Aliarcobacter skirrowii]MDX4066479.1 c-type cytochrome [Aliarcobacter skirrowii]MDY0180134.1 c-type cytochrome [Aliarcobacter skirrowii]